MRHTITRQPTPRRRTTTSHRLATHLAACFLLLGAATQAHARLSVVETYGNDGNPCTRTAPCASITAGIERAGPNGRVVVGPGNYEEAIRTFYRRTQIVSRLGADQTVITTPYWIDQGVYITADDVVFGQRDKGFTVVITYGQNGIVAEGDRIRIEGNTVRGPIGPAKKAITATGSRETIRFNTVRGSNYYSQAVGIEVTAPILSRQRNSGNAQLIQGNVVQEVSQCYALTSYANNHRNRVLDNVAEDCDAGIRIDSYAPGKLGFTKVGGGRITGNTVKLANRRSTEFPYGILTLGGNPLISDASIDMSSGGFIGIGTFFTSASTVTNSSVVGNSGAYGSDAAGMMFTGKGRTNVSGNSIVGVENALRFSRFETTRPIRNNNIWQVDNCSIVLDQIITNTQRYSGNFWGAAGQAPDTSCDPETADSAGRGAFKFAPASLPN